MADLGKVKRNVSRMVEQNAPEADIDDYIRSEGTTLDQVRSFKDYNGPGPQQVGPVEGALRQFNDTLTFGFYDKGVAAAKAALGGDYTQELERQRARTNEAARDPIPAITGRTGGMVAQGLATLPVAPVVGSYQFAKEALRPVGTAVQEFAAGIPNALRYGAAYGSAEGAGRAQGDLPNQLLSVAEGTATGAAMGPAVYAGLYGAGGLAGKVQQRQEQRRAANALRADEARAVGIDNPLPAAVSDNPLFGWVNRAVGAGIGGQPVGQRAAEGITQLQTGLNRTLARPLDGLEAGDLGRNIQGDLRRNLTQYSRSSDEIAASSADDLQRMTGPLTEEGFRPPRPRVDPVAPRQVDDVPPRDVGPPPDLPPSASRAAILREQIDTTEQAIKAQVAEFNGLRESNLRTGQSAREYMERYGIKDINSPDGGKTFYVKIDDNGRPMFVSVVPGKERPAGLSNDQFIAAQNAIEVISRNDAHAADLSARLRQIRELHSTRSKLEDEFNRAGAREASERVGYEHANQSYQQKARTATDEAAAETARLKEAARLEAESATAAAQRAAEQSYQERVAAGDTGFRGGRSRETYPTEMSAAYELSARETPKIQVNPLNGERTTKLLDSLAKEGKQSLQLREFSGDVFGGDGGTLDPGFKQFLRRKIGADITNRIEALAEMRGRGSVGQPGIEGLRSVLSDIRAAARAAEKPPYPGVPRTDEAAMLRRLAGAIQEDIYAAVQRVGQPTRFTTAQGEYKVTPRGNTQLGDKAPAEATYYVTPENFARLTRGGSQQGQTYSMPATLSLKAEKGQVGRFDNRKGEFDRSSLIPYAERPEPGLVPIQVWGEGQRINYGSPITSRGTTTGERAVSMFRNVDEQYSQYVNELRRPLSKIFGDNVDGVQALDRLVTAAKKGETRVLSAYMRVMDEKSDPTKGAAAVVYHMTGGGKDISRFLSEWRELPAPSRRILFDNDQARVLERELNRFVSVGQRYEKFVTAAKTKPLVDPSRMTHLLTAAAVYTNLPAVITMVAGNAVAARAFTSPRLLRWLTTFPDAARGGFDTARFNQHIAALAGMAGGESPEAKALLAAVTQSIKGK